MGSIVDDFERALLNLDQVYATNFLNKLCQEESPVFVFNEVIIPTVHNTLRFSYFYLAVLHQVLVSVPNTALV